MLFAEIGIGTPNLVNIPLMTKAGIKIKINIEEIKIGKRDLVAEVGTSTGGDQGVETGTGEGEMIKTKIRKRKTEIEQLVVASWILKV